MRTTLKSWQGCALGGILLVLCVAITAVGYDMLRGEGPRPLSRGPYLQQVTTDSVVVRWRTLGAVGSRVSWGTNRWFKSEVAEERLPRREHEVALTGLEAGTVYHYQVGDLDDDLAGGAGSFTTAPPLGEDHPFRVWVTGDVGTGGRHARDVRDGFFSWAGRRGADLWLMLGDNAYYDGTDAQYERAVFDTYPDELRRLPLYPTLGNHDGHSADSHAGTGPYYAIFTLPTAGEAGGVASGTEAYYAFDYGNAHFVSLETYSLSLDPSGPMLTWLESDLAATTQRWIVAFFHHPPYSKGSHDSDEDRELIEVRRRVVPLLESYGVDLVLAGHSHGYERSYLIDGHYGDSATFAPTHRVDGGDGRPGGDGPYRKQEGVHRGTIYAVVGSSAKLGAGSYDHPAMAVSERRLGSLALDFAGDRLDATFVDDEGVVVDRFVILKGAAADEEDPTLLDALTGDG